jgi:uncharacterized protein (DUF58 family)
MQLVELLKKVQELELVAKKNAHSMLTGNYVTSFPGKGLQFHEARKYIMGESIRHIDWNMTARLGEAYVKVFLDEREREVMIALDVSRSMYSGWQDRTKIEYAVELAATLAVSAIHLKDKVGSILFTDKVESTIKTNSGRTQLFRCLKSFTENMDNTLSSSTYTDIRSVLHEVQKRKGKKYILFIISDFLDKDIPDDLKYARMEHDITLFHVYDPLEYELSNEIFFPAISPETELGIFNKGILHPGETGGLGNIQNFLKMEAAKYRIGFKSFSTKSSVSLELRDFFHSKKRRTL